MNTRLLTSLGKRWHSETCTFNFPGSEMSVTLEDVYKILWILIHRYLVVYDWEGLEMHSDKSLET